VSRKVLVIDDSPTLRKILAFYLAKKGYVVTVANNGKTGLAEIGKGAFDLVILDMNMPVMTGLEVLQRLNAIDFAVPVLILSADSEEKSKAAGISLGAKYYLTKPFKPNEVVNCIEEIFCKHPADGIPQPPTVS
jgi:DNA-binding response OmpR family regulator